jgi:hypothetical protein
VAPVGIGDSLGVGDHVLAELRLVEQTYLPAKI